MKWWNLKVLRVMVSLMIIFAFALGSLPALAQVKISFYSWMVAEILSGGVGAIDAAEKKFEELNPGIDIKLEPLPYEETQDQLTLMTAAGNPPDITTIDVVWLAPLVYMGGLEPLDKFMTEDLKDAMIKAAYHDGIVKENLYALCWNPNPNSLVYNVGLLRKAGIANPPKNMEELNEQMAKISQLGRGIYGLGLNSGIDPLSGDYFHPWLWNFGGEILDEEGNVIANNKEAVDALTWFKKVMDKGYSPKGQMIREIRIIFAENKAGFMVEGPWIAGILRGAGMKDEEWGITTIPGSPVTGNMGYTTPGHHMLVLSKQCKHTEEAWKFMKFIISDPEVTQNYFLSTGLMPVLSYLYVDETYNDRIVRVSFEQMKRMKKPNSWSSPRYAEIERFFMVAAQKIMLKGADPQKTLNEAAENIKILLGGF